ncbi:hypothetical protein PR048_000750 [Dryococelus australis]|uniref:Carboxylesterase type B domain-containing protein n=1 Tax=Dryococelus australis TaxID=614101 RepID=A0ABQ9IHV4_9NEOP|nr:hypothetical protein PR048_000750 [Dryococelus australis]
MHIRRKRNRVYKDWCREMDITGLQTYRLSEIMQWRISCDFVVILAFLCYNFYRHFLQLLADNFMIYPVYRSAMLHINYGSSPLYMYLFTYDGTLRIQLGNYTTKGPAHGDVLAYLFIISYVPYSPNSDDMDAIRHFTNMWVDLAQSGDPSLQESVKWTPATKTNHTYLQIDFNLSIHQDMLKERMAFWDQVYDTYKK